MFLDSRYFSKFPRTTHSDRTLVDITRRVDILNKISKNPYVFYNYDVADERADSFAHRYYEDSYKSWLIYITNKIVDPYYEWYLKDDEFISFINKKYGSIFLAQTKIKYFQNDYVNSPNLNVNAFNALVPQLMRYWLPNYDHRNTITSYSRTPKDWIVNTNRIVSYTVDEDLDFILDERCTITFDDDNIGYGQVIKYDGDKLYLQHLYGSYIDNDDLEIQEESNIVGTESGATSIFTETNALSSNMLAEEEIYFRSVSYFDYEAEKNEFNKSIRVFDKRYAQQAVMELRDILRV
jgi:hypothetical protein